MKKIVITGGPHAGKSTILQELEKLGFLCAPEAALEIIDQLNQELGVEAQLDWRRQNRLEFQELVSQKQVHNEQKFAEHNPDVEYLFLDRGLHDGLGYMQFNNICPKKEYLEILKNTSYYKVFSLAGCRTLRPPALFKFPFRKFA